MKIVFKVENFLKIEKAEIDITNFCVFIGNNNSGKTKFLICFLCKHKCMRTRESSRFLEKRQRAESGYRPQPPACQKSPQYTLSFRTSPQTGVGIPRIEVKATGLGSKMFENSGDCHGSVRTASQ